MPRKIVRKDMKVKARKTSGSFRITRPRKVVKQDITRDEFLANLGKVARPIDKETLESD